MTEEQVQYVACGVREIVECSTRVRFAAPEPARGASNRRASSRRLTREMLMKTHPNFDIWLERASHLIAVGLSVIAAFLLRFDFAAPPGIIHVMKQALLIAIL